MLPDWVFNSGPLTYESGALPIALRGPAMSLVRLDFEKDFFFVFLAVFESISCS